MRFVEGEQKQDLRGGRPEYAAMFRDPWDWAEKYIDSYEFEGITPGSEKEGEILGEMPPRDEKWDRKVETQSQRNPNYKSNTERLQKHQQHHLFRKMNYLRKRAFKQRQDGQDKAAEATLDKAWLLRQALAGRFFYVLERVIADLAQNYPTQEPERIYDLALNSFYEELDYYNYAAHAASITFDNWAGRLVYSRVTRFFESKPGEPLPGTNIPKGLWKKMEERLEQRYDPEEVKNFLELILNRLQEVSQERNHAHSLARILRARYLMNYEGEQGATLKELADALGITRERVRQLEEKAFKIIRSIVATEPAIQAYLEKFNLDPEDIELLFLRKGGKPFTAQNMPAGNPGARGPRKK